VSRGDAHYSQGAFSALTSPARNALPTCGFTVLDALYPSGNSFSELRVHYGPGYRVYFTVRERTLLLLLIGGEKASQSRDIEKAKAILKSWEASHE
jgi:hypothetical protein